MYRTIAIYTLILLFFQSQSLNAETADSEADSPVQVDNHSVASGTHSNQTGESKEQANSNEVDKGILSDSSETEPPQAITTSEKKNSTAGSELSKTPAEPLAQEETEADVMPQQKTFDAILSTDPDEKTNLPPEDSEKPAPLSNKGTVRFGINIGFGTSVPVGALFDKGNMETVFGENAERSAAVSGLFTADFDFYFAEHWALVVALGTAIKGMRIRNWESEENGVVEAASETLFYIEASVGTKLDVSGFQAFLCLSMLIGVGGERSEKIEGTLETSGMSDNMWKYYRRGNFGPKAGVGYAIRLKKIDLIPCFEWSIHALSDIIDKENRLGISDPQSRFMNMLVKLGVYFL